MNSFIPSSPPPSSSEICEIELRGISKKFGAIQANDQVDLKARAGTIHAIVGENGAGKSTAMKILYGMLAPDAGEIVVRGKTVRFRSSADAIAAGIGMVHQHFMLAARHTALDNILVGVEPTRWGMLRRRHARRELSAFAAQYDLESWLNLPIEDLPLGVRQRVEILKLLYRKANVFILDEPTAVLTPREADGLFSNLEALKREGKTILLITHKLREVLAASDCVSIMRAGKVVAERNTADTNAEELALLMIGRRLETQTPARRARPVGETVLEARGLCLGKPADARAQPSRPPWSPTPAASESRARLCQVSFSVGKSEIVGIAGVEGNGQSELLNALVHPCDRRHRTAGALLLAGVDATRWTTREIRAWGVALIPEDRHREGLLLGRSVAENYLLGWQRDPLFSRNGWLRSKRWREAAARSIADFDVRPGDLRLRAESLSGGNQQKLIIARELRQPPRVLIAAQPSRGVDVGAVEFIHQRILKARDEGAGVLLISSDLDEVLKLSDRILVMYGGCIEAEFARGAVSESELGLKMGGA